MSHWPQYIVLGFMVLGTICIIALDGAPRTGVHSAFWTLVCNLVAGWLLFEGGFFIPIGWSP